MNHAGYGENIRFDILQQHPAIEATRENESGVFTCCGFESTPNTELAQKEGNHRLSETCKFSPDNSGGIFAPIPRERRGKHFREPYQLTTAKLFERFPSENCTPRLSVS